MSGVPAHRLRVMLGWTLILVAVVWALAAQRGLVGRVVARAEDRQVQAELALVAALLEAGASIDRPLTGTAGRRLALLAPDGQVLYDSAPAAGEAGDRDQRPEVQAARRDGVGVSRRGGEPAGSTRIHAAHRLADGRVATLAVGAADLGWGAELGQAVAMTSGLLAVAVATALALAAWRRRARILGLQGLARAFAEGDFSRRPALMDGSGLGRLGQELDALGTRLRGSLDELTRQRSLLDGALGALDEGVACLDRLDRIVYANPAFRALAADGQPVLGQLFYEHLPVASIGDPIAMARGAPGARGRHVEFAHRQRQLAASVASAGADTLVLVLHDLTAIKRLEGARRDFLAAVSHEFKTPLTSILGFADTLLDGALEQDPSVARGFIEKIARHAERLSTLVRDVLTLSRIERGGWEAHVESIDLAALANQLRDELQDVAAASAVTLEVDCPPAFSVRSDAEILRQVLGNLLSNAIRYNRPGGRAWLRIAAAGAGGGFHVVVEDTGIGIPPEHQARVFERFHRVDAHRSSQTGGTGLGLAIVQQLVGVLGGGISLHSDGQGTRFVLTLPGQPEA